MPKEDLNYNKETYEMTKLLYTKLERIEIVLKQIDLARSNEERSGAGGE